MPAVILGAIQLLQVIAHATGKFPEAADALAAGVPALVKIAAQSAEMSPEQIEEMVAAHDALVAKYQTAPPKTEG